MKSQSHLPRPRLHLSLNERKELYGISFTMLFTLGFLFFFFWPFFESIIFSLSELRMTPDGFTLSFVGFRNYLHILTVDPKFVRYFVESIVKTAVDIPAIVMFSLFIATILNQRFRGRTLVRLVFFLPVILTAGVIYEVQQQNYLLSALEAGGLDIQSSAGAFTDTAQVFLMQLKLPETLSGYIIGVVNRLPEIINASAIPILIFLAGLQSIPSSLYEAAKIEGATAWENFWMITFPVLSPLLLSNVVYILVYSFTAPENKLVRLIMDTTWLGGTSGYGLGAAMSWFYFLAILLFLGVVSLIISKRVFYMK